LSSHALDMFDLRLTVCSSSL